MPGNKPPETLAVKQDLAEAEPELFFFIVVGDALDLGDVDGSVGLLSEVVVRLVAEPRSRVDACLPQGLRQRVLGVGVALQGALDQGRTDGEWLPFTRQEADVGFSVFGPERRGRPSGTTGRSWCVPYRCGKCREQVDEFGRELVQVRLLRARLRAAVKAEREVQASPMIGSQLICCPSLSMTMTASP